MLSAIIPLMRFVTLFVGYSSTEVLLLEDIYSVYCLFMTQNSSQQPMASNIFQNTVEAFLLTFFQHKNLTAFAYKRSLRYQPIAFILPSLQELANVLRDSNNITTKMNKDSAIKIYYLYCRVVLDLKSVYFVDESNPNYSAFASLFTNNTPPSDQHLNEVITSYLQSAGQNIGVQTAQIQSTLSAVKFVKRGTQDMNQTSSQVFVNNAAPSDDDTHNEDTVEDQSTKGFGTTTSSTPTGSTPTGSTPVVGAEGFGFDLGTIFTDEVIARIEYINQKFPDPVDMADITKIQIPTVLDEEDRIVLDKLRIMLQTRRKLGSRNDHADQEAVISIHSLKADRAAKALTKLQGLVTKGYNKLIKDQTT